MSYDLDSLRKHFRALDSGLAFFDAPGGTQVPTQVAKAISTTMMTPISNISPDSVPGRNAEDVVRDFRQAGADLMGADPNGIVHGRSATQLTMDFARTLSSTWRAGENIVLSRLDHDCNVAPWLIAAERTGVGVRWATVDQDTNELKTEQYENLVDDKTRVVAVTAASNFIGTKPDVATIAEIAHAQGALIYVDAVHFGAHEALDINAIGADFAVFSPYKLFGPHLGLLAADPALLENLFPDKLRPSPETVPERFELGTLPYEQLASVTAMTNFIADQSTLTGGTRRERIVQAMHLFDEHEMKLRDEIERATTQITGLTLHSKAADRTSTLLFTLDNLSPLEAVKVLGKHGVVAQAGHFYALEACNSLGLGEQGGLRVGLAPYNNAEDIERLIVALQEAVAA